MHPLSLDSSLDDSDWHELRDLATDARAVHGFDEALERCRAFADAGADVVFFEAPETEAEIERIAAEIDAPLLLNVIEGGKTPVLPRARVAELGYSIVLHPLTLLMVAARALTEHLAAGDGMRLCQPPPTFEQLRELVGFPEHDELARRYS